MYMYVCRSGDVVCELTNKDGSHNDSEGNPGAHPGQVERGEEGRDAEERDPYKHYQVRDIATTEVNLLHRFGKLFVFDVMVD